MALTSLLLNGFIGYLFLFLRKYKIQLSFADDSYSQLVASNLTGIEVGVLCLRTELVVLKVT